MSFADAEDFEPQKEQQKFKLLSSHDALNDPSLSKEYAVAPEVLAKERAKLKDAEEKKDKLKQEVLNKKKALEETVQTIISAQEKPSEEKQAAQEPEYSNFDEKMKAMLNKKRRLMDDLKRVDDEELEKLDQDEDNPIVKEDSSGMRLVSETV